MIFLTVSMSTRFEGSYLAHCGIERANCGRGIAVREHGGAAALASGLSDLTNEAIAIESEM